VLRLSVIDNFDDFLKLEQPWNELVSQTEVDQAFMKHQWFNCWIRNLGRPENLAILTAWSDGQLMGIAPMQIVSDKLKGLPVKVLCFLSSGITPRCNFIVHESFDKTRFFDYVFGYKGWDLIITNNIASEFKITKSYIEYLESKKKKFKIEQGFMSPYVKTDSTYDDYWKSLSQSFRKNLRKCLNRLEKSGTHKVHKITEFSQFTGIFDRLLETSAKSWKGEVDSDIKSNPNLISFYVDYSRMASDMSLFELWILEIEGDIASFAYSLKLRNVLTGIRTDFDPKYKYYNPGKILQLFLLKDLFSREDVWEYDMGGGRGEHKIIWTDHIREHYIITAGKSTLYGNMLMMGKLKILPMFNKLFSRNPERNTDPEISA
jgi:hypothetical protein